MFIYCYNKTKNKEEKFKNNNKDFLDFMAVLLNFLKDRFPGQEL